MYAGFAGSIAMPCPSSVTLCERRAEPLGPIQIGVHHRQNLRKGHQSLDAGIPGLGVERRRELVSGEGRMVRILQPTTRFDDFERVGRGHQDLGKQGIRV